MFLNSLKNLPFALIIAILFASISCNDDINSIKIEGWQVLYNQDPSVESVSQKTGWQPISDTSKIQPSYVTKKSFSYLWLKGVFEIRDNPSNYYGLTTGNIRFSDRIFINEHFIGSLPAEKVNWNTVSRNYSIKEGVLKKGKNILYLYLGIYGDKTGGIWNEFKILNKEDFNRNQLITKLIFELLPFGIIFYYFSQILVFLISFLIDKKEKHYLYISLVPHHI